MPAPESAATLAPPISCRRVSFTLSPGTGIDKHEVLQDAIEALLDLAVGQRRRDVLAHGVQTARVVPGVEDVPEIGILVHGVDTRDDPRRLDRPAQVGEARDRRLRDLLAVRVLFDAGRDLRAPGVAAKVDVHLAASGLGPDEERQVAAVLVDREARPTRAAETDGGADRAGQWIGHP